MATNIPDDSDEKEQMVTDSFYISKGYQARLNAICAAADLNKSQLLRRILREHFARIDAQPAPVAEPTA